MVLSKPAFLWHELALSLMAEPPPMPDLETAEGPPPLPPEVMAAPDMVGGRGVRTVESLQRHACPQCGGKGVWNPRKRLLGCPYCGFEFAPVGAPEDPHGPPPANTIIEHPLSEMLQQLDGLPGLTERKRQVRCVHCQAVVERRDSTLQSHCEFCGSPELLDYDEAGETIKPESILPLSIPQEQTYQILRQWLGNRFWAPNSLKKATLVDRLHGVYLPYWTFDAHADCPWDADSGTYYYDTQSYTDSNGRRQTRQVRQVRWTPANGRVEHFFDDVCVPASGGVDLELLRKIEPFPTAELRPYATDYLSGWQVEAYRVNLPDAARQGEALMVETLRGLCARQVPGDTYRNLQIAPSFSAQTFKHILVPVWVIVWQHRGRAYQTLVNGITGSVAGRHPISWVKVMIAVAIVIVILLLLQHFSSK